ncbi:MAG: helix-turn-helix transcriptional regulator [Clostridia bacterium]|nr:helix-turn-helix transcriptional regulator [Clostridia bacterium]
MGKFSERLKELRKEKGITQEKLAEETGLTQGALTRYENGLRSPAVYAIITLAKYFNVTTDYLLGVTDDY